MTRQGAASVAVVMISFVCGCAAERGPAAPAPTMPPSMEYLLRMRVAVAQTRAQMPAIIESAQRAARGYASGGRIFAAGTQEEFARELIDRNGGLAEIGMPPARMDRLRRGDVILFGVRSDLTINDRLQISRWRDAGVYVVAFASKAQRDPFVLPEVIIDSGEEPGMTLGDGRICPMDGALNLINAWTWTGEFIAACTRLGKHPPIAGPTRVAYRTSREPIAEGVLGMRYLHVVDRALSSLAEDSGEMLRASGRWLREADYDAARMLVFCRLFPEHFQDPRGPQPIADLRQYEHRRVQLAPLTVVLAGYSPQLAIDAAHLRRTRLIYSSSEQARDDRSDNILYLNPHCGGDDGCIDIAGYNAPALPAGTVMRSAVYWSVIAEACATARGAEIATSATPAQ